MWVLAVVLVAAARTFTVTATADDGPGSLRQAIRDVNAQCVPSDPCTIAFQIEEPSATPWKTIRVQTALPPLSAPVLSIDGATQTRAFGDTNPDGPEIEISAARPFAFNGLTVESRGRTEISDLAINGFANGLTLRDGPGTCQTDVLFPIIYDGPRHLALTNLYVGTDPTGSMARPNVRGIDTLLPCTYATIRGSVVSGNVRSGIFLVESSAMTIAGNRIGVLAREDVPLPNGASGIYVGPARGTQILDNTVAITENVIAFHPHFGVAVQQRDAHGPAQPYVQLSRNRIWGNAIEAIDVGLDGRPTPVVATSGFVEPPVITSIRHDPDSASTVVEGEIPYTYEPRFGGGTIVEVVVELFGSDSPGDAQRFLAAATLRGANGSAVVLPARFRIAVPGDLTGSWITATCTRAHFDHEKDERGQTRVATSELSGPVLATR